MGVITASADAQALLAHLRERTEIRNEHGDVLGYFTPLSAYEAEICERAKALFDPAEIERRLAEQHGKGRPLKEIWRDLQAREAAQ